MDPTFFLFSVSISVQCLFYVLCSPPFMSSLFFNFYSLIQFCLALFGLIILELFIYLVMLSF